MLYSASTDGKYVITRTIVTMGEKKGILIMNNNKENYNTS